MFSTQYQRSAERCPTGPSGYGAFRSRIIALSAAADDYEAQCGGRISLPERIILSGTGLVAYKEVEERMMSLPILSTLRSEIGADMLAHVKAKRLISFRGSCDEIFLKRAVSSAA